MCGLEIEVEVGNLGELLGGRIRTEFTHGGWDTVKRVSEKVFSRPKAGPCLLPIFSELVSAWFPPSGDHPSPAVCSCVRSVLTTLEGPPHNQRIQHGPIGQSIEESTSEAVPPNYVDPLLDIYTPASILLL